jgi:cytochrome c553
MGEAQDAQAGMHKAAACATCHRPEGIAQAPDAPHLAGQPAIYLAEQLKACRGGKRTHEVMGVIAKKLSDTDLVDLAAWFVSIEIKAEPKK